MARSGVRLDIACYSSDDRALVFNTSLLQAKTSRTTQGVGGDDSQGKARACPRRARAKRQPRSQNISRYRVRSLPGRRELYLKPEDRAEQQLSLMD